MLKYIYKIFHRHYHRRYHGEYSHAKQLFVFDMFLLFVALCLFGASLFLFFWKPGITDQIQLTLSLGDGRVRSGEEVRLTTSYTNRSKIKLQNAVLGIRLPRGFIVDRTRTPESLFSKQSVFTLGELAPGGSGQADVYGWFWAEPRTDENILALLTYYQAGSNNPEQKLGSFLARLPESVLRGNLIIASSSFPNIPISFSYQIQNTGSNAVEGIKIYKNWQAETNYNELANLTLAPGETKDIKGRIQAPNKEGGMTVFAVPQVLINNQLINQTTEQKIVSIIFPQITASARIINAPAFAEPKQSFPVEFSWHNNSNYTLGSLRMLISATPGMVDWARTARENHLKIEGGMLLVDSGARTALADGRPNNGDTFTINVFLLPAFSLGQTEVSKLEITPIIEARLPQVASQTFTQRGAPAMLPVATELSLNASARYYTEEGDQLGRGVLPPRVGETTKYWIMIQINNTNNPIRDVSFSAILPPGATFTGKQSVSIGPSLSYSDAARAVTWNYRAIPANSQTGLYFEVAVTPTADQVGKTITLVNNIHVVATDDTVNKPFALSKQTITNVLPAQDRGAQAGAAVVGR